MIPAVAETAARVDYRLVQEAYENVYMRPNHDVLSSKMPAFARLFAVSGGPDDALLRRCNQLPARRKTRWRRRR